MDDLHVRADVLEGLDEGREEVAAVDQAAHPHSPQLNAQSYSVEDNQFVLVDNQRVQPAERTVHVQLALGDGLSAFAQDPNGGLLVARESADPDARLYQSTDDGQSWSAIALPHIMGDVVTLRAFAPGPMYALDDAGQVWRADSTNFSPSALFLARFIDVSSASLLHAISTNHTVYRSTDGGTSWQIRSTDLADNQAWAADLDRSFSFGVDGNFGWLASPNAVWTSNDGVASGDT